MKNIIIKAIEQALSQLVDKEVFPKEILDLSVQVERTKDPKHGDLSSNISMQLARVLRDKPLTIATQITEEISKQDFSDVSVAAPGFINFTLSNSRHNQLISEIIKKQSEYGVKPITKDSPKWLFEFVSANPTGPLHVGHGRGSAYGATLANILKANGINVFNEYYVNDAGRQMDILTISVYFRYLEELGVNVAYPSNAYQADYCKDIAKNVYKQHSDKFTVGQDFFDDLPIADYQVINAKKNELIEQKIICEKTLTASDKEQLLTIKSALENIKQQLELAMDARIAKSKQHLGEANYQIFFKAALETIREDIKDDLFEFGVSFDNWFSERSLFDEGKIKKALDKLESNHLLYEKNGAIWFKSTEFGDEKDRVVQRDNGLYTYFASDIAYHHDKFERGFDYLLDIFGADHHGYMARIKAALIALGHDIDRLKFELVQFAVLSKNGEMIQMSTRSGKYVTLRELRKIIGNSAARFFYVMRKPQQHMTFDLDLAVSQSKDNPLYYIQYAHARISSLLNKASAENLWKGVNCSDLEQLDMAQLGNSYEQALFKVLERYNEVLALSAKEFAPHVLVSYLKDLATALHSYYDASNIKFLAQKNNREQRLYLLAAAKQLLANGLTLIGVDAPESM